MSIPAMLSKAFVTYTNGAFVLAITDKATGKNSTTTQTCDGDLLSRRRRIDHRAARQRKVSARRLR
jgi:hypothetical protein